MDSAPRMTRHRLSPLTGRILTLIAGLWALAIGFASIDIAFAQDRPAPMEVLDLSASASSDVAADLAVVTLSVVREGPDVAALSQDVDKTLSHALQDSKDTPGVNASSGGYSTQPRYDNKGQRTGWQVHGDVVLKSRDFPGLGKLIGRLTSTTGGLQVTNSSFEVSPELRQHEEGDLIARAIAAFTAKTNAAVKSLGYTTWVIRNMNIGNVNGGAPPVRPMMMSRALAPGADALAPMPLEPGQVHLQLDISGSVQMRR
jgi:predicted secreted protein